MCYDEGNNTVSPGIRKSETERRCGMRAYYFFMKFIRGFAAGFFIGLAVFASLAALLLLYVRLFLV